MSVMPDSNKEANFAYSTTNGSNFQALGQPFVMNTDYRYFTGYRFAIFNFATKALGGSVRVVSFENQQVDFRLRVSGK